MEIYLVGGAVRDTILRYPFHEKDWVVVGASPQAMLAAGYKPVGKDFPVFLHPETGEEYALARQERKTAPGYGGFEFNTSPDVSLEEDLLRRDLTINAMAMTPSGELIDPFGGSEDLAKKVLRHVSPAFSEDPVRVLRLARFAARYAHLGFTIASETCELAIAMVERGEVDHLVAERVWKELQAALGTRSPQVFIETLRKAGALKKIMPELDQLFGVPQPQQHHPEIDCGIHSLLTLSRATQLSEDLQLRFAALVHDLGKGSTSENILPHHYGHEERGVALINTLCKRLSAPNNYRELATLVCRYHTHCHRAFELNATTLLKTLEALDALRRPDRFELFCLACQADAQGRTGFESRPYPQADYFRKALSEIQSVEPRELVAQGFKGGELGKALRNLRIEKLQSLKQAQMSEQ